MTSGLLTYARLSMDENGNEQPPKPTPPTPEPSAATSPLSPATPELASSDPIPVPDPFKSVSGSQIEQTEGEERHKKTTRRLLLAAGAVVAVIILVLVGVFYGSDIGSSLNSPLVNTSYTNAKVNYDLKFYAHSTQQLSNNLEWMTQGGKKQLDSTTTVLVSPPLGRYGTGVAIFIVPIPKNKQPLLPKSSCTDLTGLTQVSSVQMQEDNSTAVICGEKSSAKLQVEYLFQFTQHNMTYAGFILMPYDWKQVTSNPSTAKAFLAYANLTKYNSAINTVVSSIQVQN